VLRRVRRGPSRGAGARERLVPIPEDSPCGPRVTGCVDQSWRCLWRRLPRGSRSSPSSRAQAGSGGPRGGWVSSRGPSDQKVAGASGARHSRSRRAARSCPAAPGRVLVRRPRNSAVGRPPAAAPVWPRCRRALVHDMFGGRVAVPQVPCHDNRGAGLVARKGALRPLMPWLNAFISSPGCRAGCA